ncbi:type II toxin-antitoxin system RelE/ParE family toxin [Thiomicrospira sp. ALE5]|uniref:type II toxin-antitoxin system RelE/ParE family toxin n=1 Tax=Thiomicrospira sp. ALE5 TaxID=748650 RepID=UPI000B86F674|nr:type II toxin-antitoxin system RelE/ParE family toxin [Thiomicrospira sp. ALE5]
MTKQILFTPSAEKDLILAKNFYAKVDPMLGEYCADSLMLDIERLRFFAGVHAKVFGQYRMIARTFPFSIYYQLPNENDILIVAVLDSRINPKTMAQRLG